MADSESVGSIQVDIVGDYSTLSQSIDGAAQIAQQGGEKIASALNEGAAGADALSGAVTAASVGMQSFEAQIQALVDSGSTLAEALNQVQAGAEASGTAAAEAAEQLNLFDEAIQVPYADAAGQLNLFATELEPIPQEAQAAAAATKELADATQEVGESSHEGVSGLSEFRENMIELLEAAAVVEILKEFSEQAAEAADTIARTNISLVALTGDSAKAHDTIEQLEKLGIQDGLAFPSLLQASTRMTALLGASAPVPELLAKIADGAAVMGRDILTAADSFDRLATMGTLGARQLMPLGLSLDQMAKSMNEVSGTSEATAENVAKMFKAMDQSDRVAVLSDALDRLSGVAQQAAQATFGGQWQALADQWEQVMKVAGEALLPLFTELVSLMKEDILPAVKGAVDAFASLSPPMQAAAIITAGLAAAVIPLTLAFGALSIGMEAAFAAMTPVVEGFAALGAGMIGATSSYTAMIAAGVATAAVWVGLAIAIVDVAVAYHSLSTAQDQAAVANANASKSLQEYEINLERHGIDISNLKAQYDSGQISVQQYTAGLNKLRDEYLAIHPVVADHATALKAVLDPAEALRIKMQALADAVSSTRDKLAQTTAAYDAHKATAQDVAKAYDAWQGATNALTSAQNALLPVVTNVHNATKEFVALTLQYPSAAQAAADATDGVVIKVMAETQALTEAQRWLDTVEKQYQSGNATMAEVVKAVDLVNQKQSELNATLGKLPDAAQASQAYFQQFTDQLKQTGQTLTDILPKMQAIPPNLSDVTSALSAMGIKVSELGDLLQNKILVQYQNIHLFAKPSLEEENAMWDKIGATVDKLAKTDLPAAQAFYEQHLATLRATGAAEGDVLAVEQKMLQTQIDIATKSGESATAQIVDLNNVKLAQQALIDQTRMMGDLYVGIESDILKGWDSLGKAIADNIIDAKNWGDVFKKVGEDVAKMILEQIVGTAFKALKNALLENTDLVGKLGSAFKALAGTVSSSLGAEGVPEGNKLPTGTPGGGPNDGGEVGGNASTGGGASGILGSLGGLASVVQTIFTLVNGIIQDFQLAHLSKVMGQVEENTRYLYLKAAKYFETDSWEQQKGVVTTLGMIDDRLGDIWQTLQDPTKGAGAGVSALNSTLVQNSLNEIVIMTGIYNEISTTNSTLAAMSGQLDTANVYLNHLYLAFSNLPKLAGGTPYVPQDMVAIIHQGEAVIPASGFGSLPSIPGASTMLAGAGPQSLAGGSTAGLTQNVSIVVKEASNPRQTAREIASTLKSISGKFGPNGQ